MRIYVKEEALISNLVEGIKSKGYVEEDGKKSVTVKYKNRSYKQLAVYTYSLNPSEKQINALTTIMITLLTGGLACISRGFRENWSATLSGKKVKEIFVTDNKTNVPSGFSMRKVNGFFDQKPTQQLTKQHITQQPAVKPQPVAEQPAQSTTDALGSSSVSKSNITQKKTEAERIQEINKALDEIEGEVRALCAYGEISIEDCNKFRDLFYRAQRLSKSRYTMTTCLSSNEIRSMERVGACFTEEARNNNPLYKPITQLVSARQYLYDHNIALNSGKHSPNPNKIINYQAMLRLGGYWQAHFDNGGKECLSEIAGFIKAQNMDDVRIALTMPKGYPLYGAFDEQIKEIEALIAFCNEKFPD